MSAESYQFCEGATEMGVGTADADALSTRANLEADTSMMHCESQRRRESIGVCMLSSPRQNACRKIEGLLKDAGRRKLILFQIVMIQKVAPLMGLTCDVG